MRASFRPYSSADREACLSIFDANCPTFFAPNERADYIAFLEDLPDGYEVCEVAGRVVGAFGLIATDSKGASLNWILLDPESQGAGIGSRIINRVISLGRSSQAPHIKVAASHKSAPFFAKFGAIAKVHTKNGWGPEMDRVDMELSCNGD